MMICRRFIYMIYAILQQYKGMTTVVPDPCPSDIKESTIVVDMCSSSSATANSVVLRIMTQQENCICRVMIDNQIQPVYLGLNKYDDLTLSVPEDIDCGLAVDIHHIPDISTEKQIAPFECIDNDGFRNLQLFQNSILQFKSRIINGNFTRGYCMRIHQDINGDHSQVLHIDCDALMKTKQTTNYDTSTTEQTKISDTTTPERIADQTVIYQSLTIEPAPYQTTIYDATTTERTTISDTSTTEQTPDQTMIYDATTKANTYNLQTTASLQLTTKRPKEDIKANDQIIVYIVAIACSSTVAMVLLVVLAITCVRKQSKPRFNIHIESVYTTNQAECKIQYYVTKNIQEVPGQDHDSIGSN